MTEVPGGKKKINKGLVSGFQLVVLAEVQLEVTVLPGKRERRDGEGQELKKRGSETQNCPSLSISVCSVEGKWRVTNCKTAASAGNFFF